MRFLTVTLDLALDCPNIRYWLAVYNTPFPEAARYRLTCLNFVKNLLQLR
jgi:hypothetical protein